MRRQNEYRTVRGRAEGADLCAGGREQLAVAVALYRDTFLSGFSLRDSAEFDDWQLATAEHLRRNRRLAGVCQEQILCGAVILRRAQVPLGADHLRYRFIGAQVSGSRPPLALRRISMARR